jgi:hypothetical protein
MSRLREGWARWWFAPDSPANLAACRLLFFGAMAWWYRGLDLRPWTGVDPVFWMPLPLFEWLHLGVLPAAWLGLLQAVWKTAMWGACAGIMTRVSTAVAALLGVYVLGLPHNFGKVHHLDTLVVLITAILALSRCGDAWSVDRLVARWRGRAALGPPSGEYRWPVPLVQVLMALVFFGAGVSKLRHSGLAWIFSDNMAMVLLPFDHPWLVRTAQHPWLCRAIAGWTIVIEAGAPLALVSRLARWVFIPSLWLMQLGILLLMNIKFEPYLVCYLFWVRWDRLLARAAALWSATQVVGARAQAGR